MKRNIFSLRRLRWKLTFSYTLVTVVALLALELLVVSAVVALLNSNLPPTLAAQQVRDGLAPRLEEHIDETPPDVDALRAELADFTGEPELLGTGPQRDDPTSLEVGPGGGSLFVIDEERQLLVSAPELQEFPEGERFEAGSVAGLAPLVEAALAGEESSRRLSANTGGRMLTVVPLEDDDGRVAGALVGTVRVPNLTGALLIGVGISAILLMLPAALLGTLFGFLTAWGLTRRLRRLARAAQRWSGGDFSVTVEDRSRDELGQLSRELNTMAAELEALMQTRGELATLETRNRFARDLHDSVKQQIFATSLQVAAARALIRDNRDAAEAHLAQAEELVRGTQKELNVLIHEMRPAALEGKGLASALRDYAAAWSRGSEIPAEVRVRGERETPLEVEQAVFRVAQEALANVAKHSKATGVQVDLSYGPDALTLEVADDGRGFDPGKPSGGFGLESMGERMRGLGGYVDIESAPGAGTRVICFCPLGGVMGEGRR
ncbi:HAMP domain-containing protein [Rubrobacter marinus]|uniref:HAMP domain-containing protein n=1 Tax=Rubrobacter marinus TaxID=2653852 RepID=A0A6G8PZY9_9ACTN|nr:histidine kinase [Rubrobacter marinus]QIN79789.1 HAMP domain-containing protein [Rubrobacter marinus]